MESSADSEIAGNQKARTVDLPQSDPEPRWQNPGTMLSANAMPKIRDGPMRDQPPKREDSATAVWLKLIGLLIGLGVFGLLIFWLTRHLPHHP